MNNRSWLTTFVLFVFLAAVIVLQVLSMIQSDRLYERVNYLLETARRSASSGERQRSHASAGQLSEEYPGDEGDSLIWHLRAEPRTLNPVVVESDTYTNYIVVGNVLERLFEYDQDFEGVKLKPWLAESLDISEDGLEMTVRLKDDIYFSDGVAITSDDVLFTYEAIMDPGVDAANLRNYYSNVKELVKLDDRTVKFVFNEIYWKTLETVGIFEVFPKHIYEYDDPSEFNKRVSMPVGSGPYVFERWDVGQKIVLRRNEDYWGNKPKVKKIVYRFITNDIAALQALQSGDIDYMEPTAEQFEEMTADEEFSKKFQSLVYWEPSVPYYFIGWNQAKPFFKDRRVRLAMTHIIDRQGIVDHLLKGLGAVATGTFYIYGKQGDPNIEPWPYNLERAKELLGEAGWVDSDGDGICDKDGIPFRFKFSYSTGSTTFEQVVKIFKDEASKVGVEVIADPYEWSIYLNRINDGQFEAFTIGWGGTVESDPYQIFHSSQIEGRGNNRVGFSNAEADAIIEEARRTLDEDKRYALYHRFDRLLHEEQPYTFLFTRPEKRFIDQRFENVIIHKLGLNPHEWYVPREKQRYR